MDLWSMAMATIAAGSWQRGKTRPAALAMGIGASLKLWPILFGAWFLTSRPLQRTVMRILAVGVALAAGGFILWAGWAGWAGVLQVLTFRNATGWQIESLVGGIIRLIDPASIRFESGADRVGMAQPWMFVTLFAAATPPALWASWRGATTGRLGTGWLAAIGVLLSCSALLSTQYIGWLLPAAAIAWASGDRRSTLLTAVVVALTAWYRTLPGMPSPLLVIVRNVALVVLTGNAFIELRRPMPRGLTVPQTAIRV
jgi:hypothetical protein